MKCVAFISTQEQGLGEASTYIVVVLDIKRRFTNKDMVTFAL